MSKIEGYQEERKGLGENLPWDSSELTHKDRKKLCSKYDPETGIACSAPICPLFGWSDTWYADEEICSNKEYSKELIVQNQRKIAKRSRDHDTYYSAVMLGHSFIIKSGIRGLDPDRAKYQNSDERTWIRSHPEKKELTEEERNRVRERFSKTRGECPNKKEA
jgi:hypothetical protein